MVGEPLAANAFDRGNGAIGVIEAKRNAVIVAMIIFGQVPMQMLFAAVLINALHAAFEDREIAFDCIGVHVTTRIFFDAVPDRFVFGKMPFGDLVEAAFVRMHAGFLGDVGAHDCVHGVLIGLCNLE